MAAPHRGGRDPMVTSLNDSGPGSLRDAIATAQSGDTISFSVSGTIVLTNGELLVGKDLNITGPGAASLAISASGQSRVLEIAAETTVNLSGVTICDGHAADGNVGSSNSPVGGDGSDGGGIYNAGKLKLEQCVISNCAAGGGGSGYVSYLLSSPSGTNWMGGVGGRGGAIYSAGGLFVSESTFSSNSGGNGGDGGGNNTDGVSGNSGGAGGAIFNAGRMALTDSVFDHNSAGRGGAGYAFNDYFVEATNVQQGGGAGGDGGAVYDAGHGPTSVDGCQFSFNACGAGGNGGSTDGSTGADSGGFGGAGGSGGAFWAQGRIRMNDSTFVSNQAGAGGEGARGWKTGGAGGAGGSGGALGAAKPARLTGCVFLSNQSGAGGFAFGSSQSGAGGDAGAGGAICALDEINLTACLCVSNSTGSGGYAGDTSGMGGTGGNGGSGGSIYATGALRLNACSFSHNATGSGGHGGSVPYAPFYWTVQGPGGGGGSGGAVCCEADLTAVQCTFDANKTGNGGIPGYDSGSPAFSSAPSTSGSDGGQGGAICGVGRMTLRACTISANIGGNGTSAEFSDNPRSAGIVNASQAISGDPVSANASPNIHLYFKAGEPGGAGGTGGIYCGNSLNMVLCTVAGNIGGAGGIGGSSADSEGYFPGAAGGRGGVGGICCVSTDGVVVVACSIARNRGGTGGRGGYGAGDMFGPRSGQGNGGAGGAGGISFGDTNSAVANSIVALNRGGVGGLGGPVYPSLPAGNGAPDLQGLFASLGYNLIGQTDESSGFTNGVNGDLVGSNDAPMDPVLGPLADNGGPTLTMALLHGSPALDAGDDALLQKPYSLKTDQRGFARKSGAHVDMGAFEFQFGNGGAAMQLPVVSGAMVGNGNAQANVASDVADAGAATGFQLSFSNSAPGATFTVLATSDLSVPVDKWSVIGQAVPVAEGLFQFTDVGATNGVQRYYRVSAP